MRDYKLILLLKSDLKKEQKDKLLEDVKKYLGKTESDKMTSLGEKRLAYTIKHEQKGEYFLVEFKSDKVSGELDNRLRVNESILRHLLIRVN